MLGPVPQVPLRQGTSPLPPDDRARPSSHHRPLLPPALARSPLTLTSTQRNSQITQPDHVGSSLRNLYQSACELPFFDSVETLHDLTTILASSCSQPVYPKEKTAISDIWVHAGCLKVRRAAVFDT